MIIDIKAPKPPPKQSSLFPSKTMQYQQQCIKFYVGFCPAKLYIDFFWTQIIFNNIPSIKITYNIRSACAARGV